MKLNRSIFAAVAVMLVVASASFAGAQSRENRVMRVINRASSPIFHLYYSNVDRDNWGPDQLGFFESIGTNRYEDINVDDGTGHCLYDLKAKLEDGRVVVTRNVNVCTLDTWTVFDI
jgi:hypothetical protein